jgi:hypothetical protein
MLHSPYTVRTGEQQCSALCCTLYRTKIRTASPARFWDGERGATVRGIFWCDRTLGIDIRRRPSACGADRAPPKPFYSAVQYDPSSLRHLYLLPVHGTVAFLIPVFGSRVRSKYSYGSVLVADRRPPQPALIPFLFRALTEVESSPRLFYRTFRSLPWCCTHTPYVCRCASELCSKRFAPHRRYETPVPPPVSNNSSRTINKQTNKKEVKP